MATRQLGAALAGEQQAHAGHAEAARTALSAAQEALHVGKTTHSAAAAAWSLRYQDAQVDLATLRERAASAEQRATDLADKLQRLQAQWEREITLLQEGHASTKASLRHRASPPAGREKALCTPRSVGHRRSSFRQLS